MVGMAVHGMRVKPEPFDWTSATEAQAAARHALSSIVRAELFPGDPVPPVGHLRASALHLPFFARVHEWAVWADDGRMAGWARLDLEYTASNRGLADCKVEVHPDHRRRGIGSALLETLVDAARADGRTILGTAAYEGTAGESFLAQAGGVNNQPFRQSRLRLAELDPSLLQDWVGRAAERAAGYSLVGWDDPCPDEHLEAFTEVVHVMNTAPLDDLEWEDDVWTPEEIRAWQASLHARGHEGWVLCARDDTTGRFVGFTEMGFWPWEPEWAGQGDTGVDPGHRNLGLGRWLKAAMLQRVLRERPYVRYVDTGNAGSNRPMLAINIALGFKPQWLGGFWQLKI
jgi:GNAT superfamily N-acetyltransferase